MILRLIRRFAENFPQVINIPPTFFNAGEYATREQYRQEAKKLE